MISKLRLLLRAELESAPEDRKFGSGWISGVASLILSAAVLCLTLCLRYPELFSVPEIRGAVGPVYARVAVIVLLVLGYFLSLVSLALRERKVLPFAALTIMFLASILWTAPRSSIHFHELGLGLDWFVINAIFTGLLFIPLERLAPRIQHQSLFRTEWREDLFYYFISSMFVQILAYVSLWPSLTLVEHTGSWSAFRALVASQPRVLQFLEIMVLTDFVQYWVHRAFHRVPFLWEFHSIHHSAKSMDWMAGARMHVIEIIVLRAATVAPMQILGYEQIVVQFYILVVYVYSTLIHANVNWSPKWLGPLLVTPRFHHWHHGLEKEAIDVNFAIHFPFLDRIFGTYHLPEERWPKGYGIKAKVPNGYSRQFLHPLRRKEE